MAKAPARPRTRRTPEAAREHILEAADAVFARELPDAVGLREIAAEASVSHGLVTHYFATYEGLIDAVITRRLDAARELAFAALARTTFAPDESPLLAILLALIEDKTLMRLIAWASLSGRGDMIASKQMQLGVLVQGMGAKVRGLGFAVPQARLEFSAMAAIAMVIGWAIAGPSIERAIGRALPLTREDLRRELQKMLRAYTTAP